MSSADVDSASKKSIHWDGEKQGFRMWYCMWLNRCKQKGGLPRRLAVEGLELDKYLEESGADADAYEIANCWLYGSIGEPLCEKKSSMAYSLL